MLKFTLSKLHNCCANKQRIRTRHRWLCISLMREQRGLFYHALAQNLRTLFFTRGSGRSDFPKGPWQRKEAQRKETSKEASPDKGKRGRKRKPQKTALSLRARRPLKRKQDSERCLKVYISADLLGLHSWHSFKQKQANKQGAPKD